MKLRFNNESVINDHLFCADDCGSYLQYIVFRGTRAVLGGIRRMPTCQFFKVAYAHLQKVGAKAYVHLDFWHKKAVYPPIFSAIHHGVSPLEPFSVGKGDYG
jgi:hypothetical protein